MDIETANALTTFTTRYCDAWHEKDQTWPQSADLYGVPSPCIISSVDDYVIWQPKPFDGEQNVNAVERAMEAAKAAGAKRALPLPVSVPSHCSLMKPAAEKLAEALQNVAIHTPQIRVIHNADVAAYDDADKIKDALVRQLYSPVRWTETVNALVAEGIAESAECGRAKCWRAWPSASTKKRPAQR